MGVSSQAQDADLSTAFAGGDTFLERIEQLAQAKAAAERAEASLNLGMSAKSVLDQAAAKTADANRVLREAQAKADAIVADAKTDAEQTVSNAKATANLISQQAGKILSRSESDAAEMKSSAEQALADAKAALSEAQASLGQLKTKLGELATAQDKAASDRAEAARAKQDFEARIATLRSALADAVKE